VGQVRRDRHHRDARQGRGVLGGVDGASAADPDDGLVRPGAQLGAERDGRVDRAALHLEDLAGGQRRADVVGDLLALPGADRDGDAALGGDAAVGEQLAETDHGAAPDVDGQRRGEHPCQQGHGPPSRRAAGNVVRSGPGRGGAPDAGQ
jgi:hypothetical protein